MCSKFPCDNTGICLVQVKDGTWKSFGDCIHKCKPVACNNCSQLVAEWTMTKGYCLDCDMAKDRSQAHFENRKTRLYCDECLKPLDPKFHRKNFKTSLKPWVQEHYHKLCWMRIELLEMGSTLDDEEDDDSGV